jgi:type II secretory pathway pseudopilin PulG
MRFPRHSWLTMQRERGRHRASGLVLVELLLLLLVLVLAVILTFTVLGRIRQRARLEQLGTDLRVFAAVLEKVHAESGHWPATAEAAGARLREVGWSDSPAVGGEYGWVPPEGAGRPGRITLTAYTPHFPLNLSQDDLLELDRRIDDGDPATGRLRTGFNGWPVYLVGD